MTSRAVFFHGSCIKPLCFLVKLSRKKTTQKGANVTTNSESSTYVLVYTMISPTLRAIYPPKSKIDTKNDSF